MWRCIRRMLPKAWKSHLVVKGYFKNIKAPEWFHFSILREMELCVRVCVQVCKREGEAGEKRGSGVKGERGETGW